MAARRRWRSFSQICGRPRPVVPVVVAVAPGQAEAEERGRAAAGEEQPQEKSHYRRAVPSRFVHLLPRLHRAVAPGRAALHHIK